MLPAEARAIFFDAVGTLIFPDPPAAEVYVEVGQRHGSRHSIEVVHRRFAAVFAAEEAVDQATGLRTSEERERQRWQNIVASVLDDVAAPQACFRELYEYFANAAAWRLDPQAPAVLQHLQERGYYLGMASNFDRRLRTVVAGLAALSPLKGLVISSEVGWRKPSGEMFTAMCRAAGQPPDKVVYVGDDPVNDEQGALAAGMHALLLAGNLRALIS